MPFYGTLKRSNNPYIESIEETWIQESEKDLRYVGLIGKKILKKG